MERPKCDLCDFFMNKIDTRSIGDTKYNLWKCDKCNHIVAREE